METPLNNELNVQYKNLVVTQAFTKFFDDFSPKEVVVQLVDSMLLDGQHRQGDNMYLLSELALCAINVLEVDCLTTPRPEEDDLLRMDLILREPQDGSLDITS
ncbi:hypothetical protein JCM19294_1118 [Nonlabens tegetincola]|uniref:Uncharacterized protein n=1 Tax=Nonlabens tegetincola TaxID=323273 RepID=A0A090Q142_9FLAO|nr:hypothetical protein [Nonlabens tegetincola]GAK96809.1 hypothetical protein JCM19294_1118 [Nonlabens tegetincola]